MGRNFPQKANLNGEQRYLIWKSMTGHRRRKKSRKRSNWQRRNDQSPSLAIGKNLSQDPKHKSNCWNWEEDDQKYVPRNFNPEQKKCFIENLPVVLLRYFISFSHAGFLVNFTFALMLIRLGLVLKQCQLFSMWELFKHSSTGWLGCPSVRNSWATGF